MTIDIRPPTLADFADWNALWRGYQQFYKTDIPPATTDETWKRIHDEAEPVWAALAWEGDQTIGLVQWIFHRSTWSVENFCYLNDLFVSPDVRGGGIGRRLIEHVRDKARAGGCSRLYWLTHRTNAQAMRLYDAVAENSGFVQYRMPIDEP